MELYGRGVSTEAESPPPSRRRIGGPQPTPDQSPVLFDKAKKYIMKYPDKIEDSDEEQKKAPKNKTTDWLKTQDSDVTDKSATVTPTPLRKGPEPPKEPPTDKSIPDSESEEESSEEEEEEEGEVVVHQHKTSIIGYRTITPMGPDGVRKEAPIVPVKPQAPTSTATSAKPYTSPAMNGIQRQEESKKSPQKTESSVKKQSSIEKRSPTIES